MTCGWSIGIAMGAATEDFAAGEGEGGFASGGDFASQLDRILEGLCPRRHAAAGIAYG